MRLIKAEDPCALDETARVLSRGGVALIPTDTVYGIAAHPRFPAAVERLYAAKKRDARKPVALLAASAAAVSAFGAALEGRALALARLHWPGALTLVLPCGGGFEGFRVPDSKFARDLCERCGGVLRVSSANISGSEAAADAAAALAALGAECDIAVDGGPAAVGAASTVVKFASAGAVPEILRAGPVEIA